MSLSYAIKEYNFIGPGFNKFGIQKLEKVSDLNVGKAMDLVKFIDWYLSPENLSMDGELGSQGKVDQGFAGSKEQGLRRTKASFIIKRCILWLTTKTSCSTI